MSAFGSKAHIRPKKRDVRFGDLTGPLGAVPQEAYGINGKSGGRPANRPIPQITATRNIPKNRRFGLLLPALVLQPITGLEEPGHDGHAQRQKTKCDRHA